MSRTQNTVIVALVMLVVLLCGSCGQSESDRFDTALKNNIDPIPTSAEIIRACNAMERTGWDFLTLSQQRGITRTGQDRIVDIAAIIENARWDYINSGNRSQLSWDRYYANEEWKLYCSEKRR